MSVIPDHGKKTKGNERQNQGNCGVQAVAGSNNNDYQHTRDLNDNFKKLGKRDRKRQKQQAEPTNGFGKTLKPDHERRRSPQLEELENKEAELEDIGVSKDVPLSYHSTPSTIVSSPPFSAAEFDVSVNNSASSSVTSPLPSPQLLTKAPSEPCTDAKLKAEQRQRLQARIEALRATRKADSTDGAPVRTRQELLETRRQKASNRKALKKEQRRKGKEEEERRRAETLSSGSPLLSPGSPMSPLREGSSRLKFGRIDFGAGQRLSDNLDAVLSSRVKQKGPSDPGTALIATKKRDSKLASLDGPQREEIASKDSWLKAKKRAQGEAVRDDSSLLKQTLKRKQKQKKKSEKEWTQRIDGVKKSQEMQQKKRQANLAKRREAKGQKGKKNKKTKARPGFEGSFRTKAPGSSNKAGR